MAISPEKNDVDISVLFKWGKRISIVDNADNEIFSCYIRLVGDAELNRARVFGLRKSAELRRKLKEKDSEERLAFIADYDDATVEKLIELLVYVSMREITTKAIEKIDIPFPKEPDEDATLEEQEKYQLALDNWPTVRENEIKKLIDAEVEKLKANLSTKTKDELYKTYEELVVNEMCETEMGNKFRQMCTFYGLYKDEKFKERLFESFDVFENLPTEYKQQFLYHYGMLELPMDQLKK